MTYKYIIIDGDSQSSMMLQSHISSLTDFHFSGYANNREEGINCILEQNPDVVFLGNTENTLDFTLINELYKYMIVLPKFVLITDQKEIAIEAIKYDIYDFLLKPFQKVDLLKTLMKFRKENGFNVRVPSFEQQKTEIKAPVSQTFVQDEQLNMQPQSFVSGISNTKDVLSEPIKSQEISLVDFKFDTKEIQNELIQVVKQTLESKVNQNGYSTENISTNEAPKRKILCVKSYGDYRFVEFKDIVYLKADNNSTDIILSNGDSITAFKTLKHFESSLPSEFLRVHNSHIINIEYISRIHLGNSDCYLNKGKVKLPFSKSYKENINAIIELFAPNGLKDD